MEHCYQRKVREMLSSLKQPLSAPSASYCWDTVQGVCAASVNLFIRWFFKMNALAESCTYRDAIEERLCWMCWRSDGQAAGRGSGCRALCGNKVRPERRSVGCQRTGESRGKAMREAARKNLSAQHSGDWAGLIHSFRHFWRSYVASDCASC